MTGYIYKDSGRPLLPMNPLRYHAAMRNLPRRTLLQALPLAFAARRIASAKAFTKPLGVQLYTVRSILPKEPRPTLEALAAAGFTQVEILRPQIPQLAPICKELKLAIPSGHYEAPFVTGNWEPWKGAFGGQVPTGLSWEKAVDEAAATGLKVMAISYLMPGDRGGLDVYRRFVDQMNKAGERSAKAGLQLCYHNHAFEFASIDGQRPFDIMDKGFDSKLVHWEADLFWIAMAGEDPSAFLRARKGRVDCVHLKDIAQGTQKQFSEGVPRTAFKEVGSGTMNWPPLLKACEDAGVRFYFVEQDQTPGNPLDSVRQSVKFLRSVSL